MNEYLCITVLSRPGEDQGEFASRLSELWTGMLRGSKDEFEKVYAETTTFEARGDRWSRQYLVQAEVAPLLEELLAGAGVEHEPIDPDEVYSRYEATPPEWMQIEH